MNIKNYVCKKLCSDLYKKNQAIEKEMRNLASQMDMIKKINSKNTEMQKIQLLMNNNVWFYSLMKSGTTYTINFLINYINIEFNDGNEALELKFLNAFHSTSSRLKSKSPAYIRSTQNEVLKNTNFNLLIHTHNNISDFSAKRVMITRNPLDYIVSKYFWHYKERGANDKLIDVWESICNGFISVYKSQLEILNYEQAILLRYEDITRNNNEFKKLLEYLELRYNEGSYNMALQFSSKEYIKKMESKKGSPIIAGNNFKGHSFIRNGSVGDWKNHIDNELKEKITLHLKVNNICINQFVIE